MLSDLAPRWQRLSGRERVAVGAGAAIVAAAVGWFALWQPLVRSLDETERELRQARARLAVAQSRADDIATASRQAHPPMTTDPKAGVVRALTASGLRSAATSVEAQDGGVRVTFAATGLDALAPWLDAVAREEHLFPAEMTLTRRVEPGRLRAEITLAR
jgi:type II secretory pathway component PulM